MNAAYGQHLLDELEKAGLLKEAEHGVRYAVHPVHSSVRGGAQIFSCWNARSKKPVHHWLIGKHADVDKYLAEVIASEKARIERKIADKAERAGRRDAMRKALQVGALLVYSWGYDQTNVEFFEVVRRSATGATVWLRQIASEQVRATGPMASEVRPVPGSYLDGEPIKKLVTDYGVSFDHGSGRPTSVEGRHYCSWYA